MPAFLTIAGALLLVALTVCFGTLVQLLVLVRYAAEAERARAELRGRLMAIEDALDDEAPDLSPELAPKGGALVLPDAPWKHNARWN